MIKKIQEPTLIFFAPLVLSYLTVCVILVIAQSSKYRFREIDPNVYQPARAGLEFIWASLAVTCLFLLGQAYRSGFLFYSASEPLKGMAFIISNMVIYSPMFAILIFRKQSLETVYLSRRDFIGKAILGLSLSVIAIFIFVTLRNQFDQFATVIKSSITWRALSNFPAIFLEGVAAAFLFVRLQWLIGVRWAIPLPSFLFAISHVPGSVSNGEPLMSIVLFFILNSFISAFALYTCFKTKDVVCIGIVHYFMDVAIRAF